MDNYLVKLIKILFLLTTFKFGDSSFHNKWLKDVKDETTSIHVRFDQSTNSLINAKRSSNFTSLTPSITFGTSQPKDSLIKKVFGEKILIPSSNNNGQVFYTLNNPAKSFVTNRDQYALSSKKQGLYQYFSQKPFHTYFPRQIKSISDRAGYSSVSNNAQFHPHSAILKLSNLKTLALDERQKPSFSDFTSALQDHNLKVISQQDVKDLSRINPEALFGPISPNSAKHEVPSLPVKPSSHSSNDDPQFANFQNYHLNKPAIEAGYSISSLSGYQNSQLSSDRLQSDYNKNEANYDSLKSGNYAKPLQGLNDQQEPSFYQKQSNSGFTAYISPYEHKNSFGAAVHSAYEQSGSPMAYFAHVSHLSHTPSQHNKQEYGYKNEAPAQNQNNPSSGSGLSYSSSVRSHGYIKLPANVQSSQIAQSDDESQNSQIYKMNPVIIASSSDKNKQSYLDESVIYGSSISQQQLANTHNVGHSHINEQEASLTYNKKNNSSYLNNNSYLTSSNNENSEHSLNNFKSYNNDQSNNGENEIVSQTFGARKLSNSFPSSSSLPSSNASQNFNKLNVNYPKAVVHEYYIPVDCLKKGSSAYSFKLSPTYASAQAPLSSSISQKSIKYPFVDLSNLDEIAPLINSHQTLNTEYLNPSKLNLKIIHLPISVFKKMMGSENSNIENYETM